MRNLSFALLVVSCLSLDSAFTQVGPLPIPYQRQFYLGYEKELNDINKKTHSSFKPFITNKNEIQWPNSHLASKRANSLLQRKVSNEHLFYLKDTTENWNLSVDPLFDFQLGKETVSGSNTFNNTRGIQVMGNVGTKFAFYSAFYENQSKFAPYIKDFIVMNDVVPGQGMAKRNGDEYDYAYVYGMVSYTPSKHLNIQFGNDRVFIGDGYRSLLLSDASFAYPHLKLNAMLGPIRYHYVLSQYTDLRSNLTSPILGKPSKYSTISYLDWAVNKRLNIGLFQGVIWVLQDTTGKKRPLRWNYLNPIVFLEPLESSTSSEGNVVAGLNLRYKINPSLNAYGQLLLDEFILKELRAGNGFFGNKFAFQLGLKAIEPLKVKDLHVQTEINSTRPYTYSHWSSLTNYAQYNQPLAHPRGANFWEWVNLVDYQRNRYYASMKFIITKVGLDEDGKAWGNNLNTNFFNRVNEYGNYIGQGLTTHIKHAELQVGYIVNPKTNMRIFASYLNRSFSNAKTNQKTNLLSIGIATQLRNNYYDF